MSSFFGWVLWFAAAAAIDPSASLNPPRSMVCLGDELTARAAGDLTDAGWCAGTDSVEPSHLLRLRALAPGAGAVNLATRGARMRDLVDQVARIQTGPEYVAILLGKNDVCARTEPEMTPPEEFRAQLAAGLSALANRFPQARLYVLSLPDLYALWLALHHSPQAAEAWRSPANACPVLLLGFDDEDDEATLRRERVRERIDTLNTVLAEECARFVHCRFDEGVTHDFPFTAARVDWADGVAFSDEGEGMLASLTWPAGFDFTDHYLPLSHAEEIPLGTARGIVLHASDDRGVAGLEYVVPGRGMTGWRRFESKLYLGYPGADLDTVFYRAVDVNGNTENTRSFNLITGDDAGTRPGDDLPPPPDDGEGELPACGCTSAAALLVAFAAVPVMIVQRRRRARTPPR